MTIDTINPKRIAAFVLCNAFGMLHSLFAISKYRPAKTLYPHLRFEAIARDDLYH